MLWLTVSKAFCKSINTAQTDCLLSSDFSISSINLIITSRVEKLFRKPNFRSCITLLCIGFSMILSVLERLKTGL